MSKSKNLIAVKTVDELNIALKGAKGVVILDFVDLKNCDACQADAPRVEKLVESCPDVTVIRADVNSPAMDELADRWKVIALPTLFIAEKPDELTPGKAIEAEDAKAAMKLLRSKCKR